MKKLLALFSTLAVAFALSVPVFASQGKSADTPAKTETASNAKGKSAKSHMKHAKKKGATEGKKAGQEGTPGTTK